MVKVHTMTREGAHAEEIDFPKAHFFRVSDVTGGVTLYNEAGDTIAYLSVDSYWRVEIS